MRAFRILSVVLFCAAVIVYICAAVPEAQAQDETLPVLTDTLGRELSLSVTAPTEAYYEGLHAEDAHDGDLTDAICIAGMSALLGGDRRRVKYVVFDEDRHAASLTRTIRYTDYAPPKFVFSGTPVCRTGELSTLLSKVTAEDLLDGDVSDRIRFYTEKTTFIGEEMYAVRAAVTNTYGGQSEMQFYVQMSDNSTEIRLKQGIVYLKVGETFDPKEYFEGVFDRAGMAVKVKKQTAEQEIDPEKPGCYPVRYIAETETETVYACLTVIVEEEK